MATRTTGAGLLAPGTKSEKKDLFYAFAAAFGALWGTIEITLGAFLHTLRLPFAGILLSALAAAILVGERQLLPRRGLSLATGVVAAMCKSISPGGIILSPMIAIIFESVAVEIALSIAPRTAFASALSGALCTAWSAFQGILFQYIFYGKGVIDLYVALLHKTTGWLGISASAGWWALWVLLFVIVGVGAAGGIAGRQIGRQAGARLESAASQGMAA